MLQAIHPAGQQRNCIYLAESVSFTISSIFHGGMLTTNTGNKFLQAIPPDTVYLGPNSTHQDECGCSSAVYILTSACGACQSRPWVNYVSWARECPEQMKSIGYPKDVPIRVTIPEWARMNVSELAGQNFDPAKARMGEYRSSSS
jgi:hypothetical protein